MRPISNTKLQGSVTQYCILFQVQWVRSRFYSVALFERISRQVSRMFLKRKLWMPPRRLMHMSSSQSSPRYNMFYHINMDVQCSQSRVVVHLRESRNEHVQRKVKVVVTKKEDIRIYGCIARTDINYCNIFNSVKVPNMTDSRLTCLTQIF